MLLQTNVLIHPIGQENEVGGLPSRVLGFNKVCIWAGSLMCGKQLSEGYTSRANVIGCCACAAESNGRLYRCMHDVMPAAACYTPQMWVLSMACASHCPSLKDPTGWVSLLCPFG